MTTIAMEAPTKLVMTPEVKTVEWENTRSQRIQHKVGVLHSVLDQIPAEQRMVIELAYFGGFTHAEISEQLHIPLGTVKGRMRLGLQKLKTFLAERGLGSM